MNCAIGVDSPFLGVGAVATKTLHGGSVLIGTAAWVKAQAGRSGNPSERSAGSGCRVDGDGEGGRMVSLAVMVTVLVLAVVGVPLSVPSALRVIPVGSSAAWKVTDPPITSNRGASGLRGEGTNEWKGQHRPDRCAGQHHHYPVDTEPKAAGRRHTYLQRSEEIFVDLHRLFVACGSTQ